MNASLGTVLNTVSGTDALHGILTRDCRSSSVPDAALSGDYGMWQFWCFFGFAMFML
jgi:hypothetical protein